MEVRIKWMVLLVFLVEALLILGTDRLTGVPTNWKRVLAGAGIAGFWGGAGLLPGMGFLHRPQAHVACLLAVCLAGFGSGRAAWRRWGLYLLISFAITGIARNFAERKWLGIAVAAFLVWLLCIVSSGDRLGGRLCVPLEIRYGGNILQLTALRDTGNMLRDPITGEQVLVIDGEAASQLTGLRQEELEKPMDTIGIRPGYRLIPYRSVGQPRGMMLAKRFQDVRVGDWRGSAVVAFAPHTIGGGGEYRALTGGAMG